MGRTEAPGFHFEEAHPAAAAGRLPGRFAAGEAAADDCDRLFGQGGLRFSFVKWGGSK